MKDTVEKRLRKVDQATLTPLVRRSLENDRAQVLNWHHQPIEGGFGGAYGVYRFSGKAQVGHESLAWSLILKILGPKSGSADPTAWNYWKREVLVYQSGLLTDLPGNLVAPRCIAIKEHPEQEFWIWLEDIIENEPKVWPLDNYGLAARHLGQFNGAYLMAKARPQYPWLSTSQFHQRLTLAKPNVSELPRLSQLPIFAGLLPSDSVQHCLALWTEREQFLSLLNQLPQTLCHHDAFRRNLMARDTEAGQTQTIAIDWAELGTGVIGTDIVSLLTGSLRFTEFNINGIAELDRLIFAGYIDGLHDVGWQGDERLIRFGYTALAALESIADKAIKWPGVAKRVAALAP